MQLELSIHPSTLAAVVAPPEFAVELITEQARYSNVLYIAGNHSVVIPKLSRRRVSFDVRRAFTAYQLLQILSEVSEAEHDVVLVEYNGFEESDALAEAIFLAMRELARNGTAVIHYSAKLDGFVDFIVRNADRFVVVREANGGFVVWDSGSEFFIGNQLTQGDYHGQDDEQH